MASTVGGVGLLLLSSNRSHFASRVKECLLSAKGRITTPGQKLYVCVLRDKDVPLGVTSGSIPLMNVSTLSQITRIVYSEASAACPIVDVRLLLKSQKEQSTFSGSKGSSRSSVDGLVSKNGLTMKAIEWILAESSLSRPTLDNFVSNIRKGCHCHEAQPQIQVLDTQVRVKYTESESEAETNGVEVDSDNAYHTVVLGGTFDRLHNGHKVLLMEAVIRCTSQIIVGVTDQNMIEKKKLHDLIQPIEVRIAGVTEFLEDMAPSLVHRVVPISDPFGPAIEDENIQLIVVSEETKRGAIKINEIRKEKNFPPLLIHVIPIFDETTRESDHEEEKISSSSKRIRLLGQRLQPPLKPPSLPYIIGLTGGIGSGKSSICKYLNEVKHIPSIDCDKLGHDAYKSGTPCFDQIVSTFGSDILRSDGEIERRSLGAKVFGNPTELRKLTDIVWPEIRRLAQQQVSDIMQSRGKIIVLDAAVLLEAGWDSLCHEVWVTFIPRAEAISRIQERDNLPEEKAVQRIDSQMSNGERLKKATFAFSSLWEPEFTRIQISKALNEIQSIVNTL